MEDNWNGFNNRIRGNNKIVKALDIKEELDIACLMYCEHRLNFWHKDNSNDLAVRNVHKDKHAGRVQEGGTGTICLGDIMGYVKMAGHIEEGLGWQSWILLGGAEGHNTQIITTYTQCKNRNVNSGTSYQQQHHYLIMKMKKKDITCPLIFFYKHLLKQLRKWRASGDRIVPFTDHNKHVIDRAHRKVLADKDGLGLIKAILHHT
jgi:hypothetical protein